MYQGDQDQGENKTATQEGCVKKYNKQALTLSSKKKGFLALSEEAVQVDIVLAGLHDLDIEKYSDNTNFLVVRNYDGSFEKSTGKKFIPEMGDFAAHHGERAIATWNDPRGGVNGQEQVVIMTAKSKQQEMLTKLAGKYSGLLISSYFDQENFKLYLQNARETFASNQELDQPQL
jgi:hypothetical protein